MKKAKHTILLGTLCLSMLFSFPVYAAAENNSEYEASDNFEYEDLDDDYYIDEDGSIVADFLSDEEVAEIEKMRSENDKDLSGEISESAISYALSKVGLPYSNARRHSGSAYDCSSLIYYSYLNSGVDLSYDGMDTAAAIAKGLVSTGKEVSADMIQPGDLIFYSYKKNGRYHNISHVAMYIGDGLQIEASYGKQKVAVRSLSFKQAVNICRPVL